MPPIRHVYRPDVRAACEWVVWRCCVCVCVRVCVCCEHSRHVFSVKLPTTPSHTHPKRFWLHVLLLQWGLDRVVVCVRGLWLVCVCVCVCACVCVC